MNSYMMESIARQQLELTAGTVRRSSQAPTSKRGRRGSWHLPRLPRLAA